MPRQSLKGHVLGGTFQQMERPAWRPQGGSREAHCCGPLSPCRNRGLYCERSKAPLKASQQSSGRWPSRGAGDAESSRPREVRAHGNGRGLPTTKRMGKREPSCNDEGKPSLGVRYSRKMVSVRGRGRPRGPEMTRQSPRLL